MAPSMLTASCRSYQVASPFWPKAGLHRVMAGSLREVKLKPRLRSSPLSFSSSSFMVKPVGLRIVDLCGRVGKPQRTACAVLISVDTLRWVASAASLVLILTRSSRVQKSLVVPLLALTVPREVLSWMRGDYGLWVAFIGLSVRLFYSIPGELELPLSFLLLVITAPFQLLSYKDQPAAGVLTLVIASIVAYQHFSRAGGLDGAFQKGTFIASVAVILVLVIPVVFFIQGVY